MQVVTGTGTMVYRGAGEVDIYKGDYKQISWNMCMWLKNIERVCFECGCGLEEHVGRCIPLCQKCQRTVRLSFV